MKLRTACLLLLLSSALPDRAGAQITNGYAAYNVTLERDKIYQACPDIVQASGCDNSFMEKKGVVIGDYHPPSATLINAVDGWMGKLPGSLKLSEISIPGTHDSGAEGEVLGPETQTWTIAEQLEAGIRWFDIRVRDNIYQDGWDIYHGGANLDLTFDQVLAWMNAFLDANPSEAIICWIQKSDNVTAHHTYFSSTLTNYINSNPGRYKYFNDPIFNNTVPELSDVRGKIYFLNNHDPNLIPNININWQNYYKVYLDAIDCYGPNCNGIAPGDPDYASLIGKKRAIREYIDLAATSTRWVVNHLSGAEGVSPPYCASQTNYEAFHYLNDIGSQTNVGTILMDYPGEGLIYRIIKTNFCYTKRVDYSVKIDCGQTGVIDGTSTNDITVKFYNGTTFVGSDTRDGLGCEISKGWDLEDIRIPATSWDIDITHVSVETNGHNDFFIDELELAKKKYARDFAQAANGYDGGAADEVVFSWGVDGGGGWCVSLDPSGFGTTCHQIIGFDLYNQPSTNPPACAPRCAIPMADINHGNGNVPSGTYSGNNITSTATVTNGANVQYNGVQSVKLKTGFKTVYNSSFKAKIIGCP